MSGAADRERELIPDLARSYRQILGSFQVSDHMHSYLFAFLVPWLVRGQACPRQELGNVRRVANLLLGFSRPRLCSRVYRSRSIRGFPLVRRSTSMRYYNSILVFSSDCQWTERQGVLTSMWVRV